jgi:KDO2-lipid IV(A) lauroyltransferase
MSDPSHWPLKKRLKNGLIYWLVKWMVSLIRILPRPAAVGLMGRIGWLAYFLLSRARRDTERHLHLAYGDQKTNPEIRDMARQVFVDLGRNAADAIRLPVLIRQGLDRFVKCTGAEHLDRALARGRGAIIITGHIGSWELLGAYLAHRGYRLAGVGAELYDPRLNKMVVEMRELAGYPTIPRGPQGVREILRWLRSGGVLGILIDQDTRVDGVFVDFFGRPAYTPIGPVVLAQKTGAAIVPVAIHRQADGSHLVEFRQEINLQCTGDLRADRVENVRRCSKAVEEFIRQHPTQWVWMHERWKTQPEEKADLVLDTQ